MSGEPWGDEPNILVMDLSYGALPLSHSAPTGDLYHYPRTFIPLNYPLCHESALSTRLFRYTAIR